mmetsp:Transcript_2123/g.2809  ORF Transcript_2123/g.2809 Transcript_2123/m.2809 type:complete len:758 (+) Transcript_2123:172-2445(+)
MRTDEEKNGAWQLAPILEDSTLHDVHESTIFDDFDQMGFIALRDRLSVKSTVVTRIVRDLDSDAAYDPAKVRAWATELKDFSNVLNEASQELFAIGDHLDFLDPKKPKEATTEQIEALRNIVINLYSTASKTKNDDTIAEEEENENNDGGILDFSLSLIGLNTSMLFQFQVDVILDLLYNKDGLVIAPTGFGKSVMFQLPALIHHFIDTRNFVLVISPLLLLIADQCQNFQEKTKKNNWNSYLLARSSMPRRDENDANEDEVLSDLALALLHKLLPSTDIEESDTRDFDLDNLDGQTINDFKNGFGGALLYLTPEKLLSQKWSDFLIDAFAEGHVKAIIFDEAHSIHCMGTSFRPSYCKVGAHLNALFSFANQHRRGSGKGAEIRPCRCGFTATLAPSDEASVIDLCGMIRDPNLVYRLPTRRFNVNIARFLWMDSTGPLDHIQDIIEDDKRYPEPFKRLFYTLTKNKCESVHSHIRNNSDVSCVKLHGDIGVQEKLDALQKIRDDHCYIACCTDSFGLGIDIKDIFAVHEIFLPLTLEDLHQKLGRVARDPELRGDYCIHIYPSMLNAGVFLARNNPRGIVDLLRVLEFAVDQTHCLHSYLDEYYSGDERVRFAALSRYGCCINCTQVQQSYPIYKIDISTEVEKLCAVIDLQLKTEDKPPTIAQLCDKKNSKYIPWTDDSWSKRARYWVVFCLLAQREHRVLNIYQPTDDTNDQYINYHLRITYNQCLLADIKDKRSEIKITFPSMQHWYPPNRN